MEIFLDRRALKQIRVSAADAIQEGDTETLREDIIDAFSEDQIEEIEKRVDSGDFYDVLSELLDEWSGDDVDELLELLEAQLAEVGLEVQYTDLEFEEEEEADETESDDDEVIGDDEDIGLDGEEEAEEEL